MDMLMILGDETIGNCFESLLKFGVFSKCQVLRSYRRCGRGSTAWWIDRKFVGGLNFPEALCLVSWIFSRSGSTGLWLPVVPHVGVTACERYGISREDVVGDFGFSPDCGTTAVD